VQAALERALQEQHAEDALALCVALGDYWLMGYHYAREVESIDRALGLAGADAQPRLRALALCHRHRALGPLGRREEQAGGLDDAEAAARRVGDPALLAQVLEAQATRQHVLERTEAATPIADEAIRLARLAGEEWGIAVAIATRAGMVDDAETLRAEVERAARLLEQAGNIYDLAGLLADSAYAAVCLGRDRDASELVARAVPITRALDNRYMWMLLQGNAGVAALMTGDIDAADQRFREELRLGREMAVVTFATEGLEGLAAVAAARGELERAARLYGAAGAHRHGQPFYPVEERMRQLIFEPAQRRLGEDEWDAGVRDGATMSHDDAVGYALAG
jgi:tetratricopeptide (TPR) repeat protein